MFSGFYTRIEVPGALLSPDESALPRVLCGVVLGRGYTRAQVHCHSGAAGLRLLICEMDISVSALLKPLGFFLAKPWLVLKGPAVPVPGAGSSVGGKYGQRTSANSMRMTVCFGV